MRPAAEPQVNVPALGCVGEEEAVREVKRDQRPRDKRFSGWLAVFALLTQIVVSSLYPSITAGPALDMSYQRFVAVSSCSPRCRG